MPHAPNQCQAVDPLTNCQCSAPSDFVSTTFDGISYELCGAHLTLLMAHEAVAVLTPVAEPACRPVQLACN